MNEIIEKIENIEFEINYFKKNSKSLICLVDTQWMINKDNE